MPAEPKPGGAFRVTTVQVIVLISTVLIGLLLGYYFIILIRFLSDDYREKRKVIIDLIPFRLWIVSLKEKWDELE